MKSLLLLALLSLPITAHAQSPRLANARADLTTYDLTGRRTVDAVRSLGPVAAGSTADAHEAAYLRAIAATDLHVVALGTGDTALDARLAEAMSVASDRLGDELRTELAHAQVGIYRGPIAAELRLLARTEAFVAGPIALDRSDPREAALFVIGAGHAVRAHDFSGLRVTATTAVPAWLVGPGAHGATEIASALTAYDRAIRGARDGDPLLVAWTAALDAAREALTTFELRASPSWTDASLALAAADASAPVGDAPDVVVVIDAGRVAIACGARVRVTTTGLTPTMPSATCPALGTARAVALPATLPPVPGPIDDVVSALGALALPAGTTIAIAPTASAPMHVVTRTLRSLARANLTPSMVALGSGTDLRTSPLVLAGASDTPSVTVHVRLGGYAIERAHGHDAQVPRIRGASGLEYDHAGLSAALVPDAITGAAVDGMAPVPAVEVLRAIRLLASSGTRVTLALP